MQLILKKNSDVLAIIITSQVKIHQEQFSVLDARAVAPYTDIKLQAELGKYATIGYDHYLNELKYIVSSLGYTLFSKEENHTFHTVQLV